MCNQIDPILRFCTLVRIISWGMILAWQGLVVDTATSFSDSLLNPYSDRFVYASSVPVIRAAGHPRKKSHGFSASVSATSSSNQLAPSVWPKSWPTSKAHFLIWLESQPVGLLALLAELDKSESYDFHIWASKIWKRALAFNPAMEGGD